MEEVILTRSDAITPFVTKKENKYYINNIEYTDDINLLLTCIKNVKHIDFSEYNIRYDTKEEYYQNVFNYAWSQWSAAITRNLNVMWNEELTRQGKLKCPTCNTNMVMYYRSYCPICYGLQSYKYYDYQEMVNIIEAKYNFKIRDYHEFKFGKKWNTHMPYMDFWHFMIDNYFQNIHNEMLTNLNWKDVYDVAKEDWQKEIITCFRKEFSDRDYMVYISW